MVESVFWSDHRPIDFKGSMGATLYLIDGDEGVLESPVEEGGGKNNIMHRAKKN